MSDIIGEKTKIPLSWAVAIMISLGGTVATASVDQYRIGALEERFKESAREQRKHDDEDNKRDLQLAHVNDKLQSIDDTLKDMKDMIKENQDHNHR